MTVRKASIRGAWGTDLRGYLGSRASLRVLGRWKDTLVRTRRAARPCAPFRAAFLAALAWVVASFLAPTLAIDRLGSDTIYDDSKSR